MIFEGPVVRVTPERVHVSEPEVYEEYACIVHRER